MRWRPVAVLALVVFAGCNFASALSTRRPTLTPAPVPTTTPRATPDPGAALPPGVDRTGITDLNRLVESHVEAAREMRWVWRESSDRRQVFGNTSANSTRSQNAPYVDETTYRRRARVLSVQLDHEIRFFHDYDAYADGAVAYETWYSPTADGTVYQRDDTPAVSSNFAGFATGPLRDFFRLESSTVSRVDVGARPHYAVVGTRRSVPEYGPVTNYTARAVVREDGFVRSLRLSFVVDREDLYAEATYNFTYGRIGNATVERPGWIETARDATGGT